MACWQWKVFLCFKHWKF